MMIKVRVNDTLKEVSHTISLQALLNDLAIKKQGIAVAINEHIIQKCDWETTALQQDDSILIIQATQGG